MSDFNRLTNEQPDDPFGDFIDSMNMDDFNVVSEADHIDPKAKECVDEAINVYRILNTDPNMPMQFIPVENEQAELMKGILAHIREMMIQLNGQTVNGMEIMVYALGLFAISYNSYIDKYAGEEDDNDRF